MNSLNMYLLWQNMIYSMAFVFGRRENRIVRKSGNGGNRQFLLFPQWFQSHLYDRLLKSTEKFLTFEHWATINLSLTKLMLLIRQQNS